MSSGPGTYRYMPPKGTRNERFGAGGALSVHPPVTSAHAPRFEASGERPFTVYPLAIMVGVILVIVGALETLWLVKTLAGLWYMPYSELVPKLPELTWMIAVQSPAVLALPLGAWLLVAPSTGRVAVTTLLGLGVGFTLGSYDPLAGDLVRTTGQAGLFGAAILLLWAERAIIGAPRPGA